MSVNVRIKQEKHLFKKNIDIVKICDIWNNSCVNKDDNMCVPIIGVQDEFLRLRNEFFEPTKENSLLRLNILKQSKRYILFDKNNFGRGIELQFDNLDILLKLNYPTTISEIKSFYNLIEQICKYLGTDKFYRDNNCGFQLESINNKNEFIDIDCKGSYELFRKVFDDDMKSCCLFSVANPIIINKNIIANFGITESKNDDNVSSILSNFEKYLNDLQCRDLYYAKIQCFKKNDSFTFGTLPLSTNCTTIIPIDANYDLNLYKTFNSAIQSIGDINEIYVVVNYNNTPYQVKYNDFISSINKETYQIYDANHIIVNYSDEMIKELIDKYGITVDEFIKN